MNDLLTLIRSKGSSAVAIAEKLKLDKSTVTRQLKGDTKKLKPNVQREIEKILGYSLVDIANGIQEISQDTKAVKAKIEPTPKPTIPQNVYELYKAYQKQEGISDNTVKNYNKSVGRFLHYNINTGKFDYDEDKNKLTHSNNIYFTSDEIIMYLEQFKPNENGYANKHFHWRNLRTFYKYLAWKYKIVNPIMHEENGKVIYDVQEPKYDKNSVEDSISPEESKMILASNKLDARQKMMIAIPLFSSMRISEWLNITVDDINPKTKSVVKKVKGKSEKFKTLALAMPFIKAYLDETDITSGRLFQATSKYKAITSVSGMEKHFKEDIEPIAQEITGNKELHLTPHVFRRGFARLGSVLGLSDTDMMELGDWSTGWLFRKYKNAGTREEIGLRLEEQGNKFFGLTSLLS